MRAVVWSVSQKRFATDCQSIEEVIPLVNCSSVVGAPSWLHGTAPWRGYIITVVDAGALLTGNASSRSVGARIIVGRDGGSGFVGLHVDEVSAVELVPATAARHSGAATRLVPAVSEVVQLPSGTVQLVDPARILGDAERRLVTPDAGGLGG